MASISRSSVLAQCVEGRWSNRSSGVALDPWVRQVLEDRFGTSLSAVRVHTGPDAARLAKLLNADAFTMGADVFFATDRYRPQSNAGMRVLAHEIAHVVQQTGSTREAGTDRPAQRGRTGDRWEQAADWAAVQVMSGTQVESLVQPGRAPALQCHDSFEHRALGDIPTDNLAVIAGGGAQRDEIIGREIDLMGYWQHDPEAVTADQINKQCPWIRTLRLATSGLLVTYGELNALPDYIATGDTADNIPKDVLLPILQFIRQQSYIELNKLLGKTVTDPFDKALYKPQNWLPGMANTLLETALADQLTAMLGVDCTDHYQGLLARNACHFAPFSWYRWQTPYLAARSLATNAHFAQDPGIKAQLTHEAWVQHGYGDHFLQDSFAAGHLVNKTLIMQWFIEWAASEKLLWVFDWEAIQGMTTALQPGIAGRALYSPTYAGGSNDPQTAHEQATYLDRLVRTGVVVGASGDLDTAYQDYLALMSSVITQSSSAAIHDYYNSHSLWVASPAHPTPYEVWGDDTLLSGANGGTGAQMTSAAAQLSQQSIRELLADGTTSVTAQQIKDQFPTQVRVSPSNMLLDLEAWNDAQRPFCNTEIFPQLHDFFIRMSIPMIPNVSQDQDLTARWNRLLPTVQQGPAPVATQFATTTMLQFGGRIFAGSNGYVYELHPETGAMLHSTQVSISDGSVSYETRIATDGTMLYAGVHSGVAAVDLADWSRVAWSVSLSNVGTVVDVLPANGRLFAGSNGYVYEIDLSSHAIAHTLLLGSWFGQGDYTMRLAINQSTLVAGTHGWVYGVDIDDFARAAWSCQLETLALHPVEVLVHNGAVFAGSNGWVYEVSGGQVVHQLLVTSRIGVPGGDYTTTLAATDQMVFAGVHGYVYGIKRNDWSDSAWSANLAGNRYTMINLAATADQLVAGSYGYLYRIDPINGNVRCTTLLTLSIGVGGSYETRVIFDPSGACLYAGVHGYAYRISAELHSGSSLTPPQPMPGPMYNFWVVTGMVSTGVGYDITYGSINNYSIPAGYNDHCTVIVRGADGQEKTRAAAPGTGATVRVTTTPAAGDTVYYYVAAPDGTNWAVAYLTAAGAAFEFWKIRNVNRLADGYSVTYGADGYGIPAGYNDHCYISVRGPDGKEKGRTLAPGLDGTVKVAATPQSGDVVLYYLAANDGTNWGVAGFTC